MALQTLTKWSAAGVATWGLGGCALFEGLGGDKGMEGPGLGALAGAQDRFYGAAVQSGQLRDPAFAAALRREVNLLVPENELKWDAVHPSLNHFNFNGYRRIAAFALANGMAMRGHNLVWHVANPVWLTPALATSTRAARVLDMHIRRVLKETAPMIRQWDVVNEAVDPLSPRADGLRLSPWLKALGPDYVALAFQMAHEADPGLTLVYNDYGTEYSDRGGHRKRRLVLSLLEKCAVDSVPVHALGVQSHLDVTRPLAGREFLGFLDDVRALGLKIYVTELDVDLGRMRGHLADNIKAAQNYVRTYLDMLQDSGSVDMLLTWGLSDRYTWLHQHWPQATGALPLDRNMKRGPLWKSLRDVWLEG